MLQVEGLSCGYGAATVASDVTLEVKSAQMVALIGPNGAGKTTLLQCLAGHLAPQTGSIKWRSEEIREMDAAGRVRRGIAISPEGRKLFNDMTVRENLIVGGYCRPSAATRANMDKVLALFPRLSERMESLGRNLSGGEQQMVAIGRAMMAEPKLLLVDEVSLGLTPKNVDICYRSLLSLRDQGLGVLFVEQNLRKALEVADRVYVIESGRILWTGTAQEARMKEDLVETILGSNAEGK